MGEESAPRVLHLCKAMQRHGRKRPSSPVRVASGAVAARSRVRRCVWTVVRRCHNDRCDRHPYDLITGAHRRALRAWLRPRFASFGAGASFDPLSSTIAGYEHIHLGDGVFIGPHAHLTADGVEIVIGADTVIGPGFYAIAGDHRFDQPNVHVRGRRPRRERAHPDRM